MASDPKLQKDVRPAISAGKRPGQEVLKGLRANEVFVAIVGPAGSGSGTAAKILKAYLVDAEFEVEIVKASTLIRSAAERAGYPVPPKQKDKRKSIESVEMMQNRGDELREGKSYSLPEDHSAIARLALRRIAAVRAKFQNPNDDYSRGVVKPDGTRRAYIIDSLRHPAEVALLREVYKDSFTLLGIVCDPVIREKRILENFFDRSDWGKDTAKEQVRNFLTRDEDAPDKHGQHVSDTFHEADFFVDNSTDGNDDLSETGMNDSLHRFVKLITRNGIIRPTISETAMHHAHSAQMRSACLSRQVGAAIVDANGNIVSTGTNEVPRAGGGLYGEDFSTIKPQEDKRCAFRKSVFCSSNREQNEIIRELFKEFPKLVEGKKEYEVLKQIRGTRIGGLIEFSRAVHAEMDAILSASISGTSPRGCRMYVTTYPCHYCARHIVASGIDEVQFIEPYPKSKAAELHDDSITTISRDWAPPSKGGTHVLFRPFVGVAPRLYRKVFLKDRSYKDKVTGDISMGTPDWGQPTEVYKVSYPAMEDELALEIGND